MSRVTPEKKNIGRNIQAQMLKNGYTRKTLAQKAGIPYPTLSDWVAGRTSPRYDKMELLAKYLNCCPSDFLATSSHDTYFEDNEMPPSSNINNMEDTARESFNPVRIDVLGNLNPPIVIGCIAGNEEDFDGQVFALIVQGDSMYPRLFAGDTIIVKKTEDWHEDLQTGDIVIATVNGGLVCMKLQIDNDGITLIPTNEKYKPAHYSEEDINADTVAIYGKVIEVRGKIG